MATNKHLSFDEYFEIIQNIKSDLDFCCSPTASQADILKKFQDITNLTKLVSQMMVSEIRRRASSKTTENASQAIIDFLEMPDQLQSPSDKKGWILLTTLNLLVCSGCAPLIPIMSQAALPSTLVKCLYLFFDLPEIITQEVSSEPSLSLLVTSKPSPSSSTQMSSHSNAKAKADLKLGSRKFSDSKKNQSDNSNKDLTPAGRRAHLEKVFSQLLTKLCASQSALTELTRRDDLALLFNAITSWCPRHNCVWRQTAAEVILMMAKSNVIDSGYLHEKGMSHLKRKINVLINVFSFKGCISIFVENAQRMSELGTTSVPEIVEMLTVLILFLCEVTTNSPATANVLLEDFKQAHGYHFLVDFCLKLEPSVTFLSNSLNYTSYYEKHERHFSSNIRRRL